MPAIYDLNGQHFFPRVAHLIGVSAVPQVMTLLVIFMLPPSGDGLLEGMTGGLK
jgi:hypothetical protein